jgi:hypothetical protein
MLNSVFLQCHPRPHDRTRIEITPNRIQHINNLRSQIVTSGRRRNRQYRPMLTNSTRYPWWRCTYPCTVPFQRPKSHEASTRPKALVAVHIVAVAAGSMDWNSRHSRTGKSWTAGQPASRRDHDLADSTVSRGGMDPHIAHWQGWHWIRKHPHIGPRREGAPWSTSKVKG